MVQPVHGALRAFGDRANAVWWPLRREHVQPLDRLLRARTSQGHNACAQWGSSVATRGNQWVQTGHVTTARGTTAAYRTSIGKEGVISRGSNGTVARTENGVYGGQDGEIYKRNGRGNWSQYDKNGGWSQVERASPKTRDLDSSARARERGQAETQRQRSFGSGSGGGARPGGGGGGRRR